MRDKRPVDELSIEELERILAIRKREARQQQLRRLAKEGRRAVPGVPVNAASQPVTPVNQAAESPSPADAAPVEVAMTQPAINQQRADEGIPRFEDDSLSAGETRAHHAENSAFWTMVWNRSLVLLEILAFVGLVVIGFQMFQALKVLQTESAAVQAQAQAAAFASLPSPTATPQINLNQIVLPSGHTPPTSSGGAQFNLNEIPENLRPIVQQQLAAPIAIPTPGPESPVRIQIPRIAVDAPVISGTDWEALKRGVGHMLNTGTPGQPGNIVLSAHNDIYGEIFRYLDQLQPGDEIIIHTLTQQFTYVVRNWDIYSPRAVQVLDATREPTATLISCYPYQVDNQRIVVFADLIDG